MLFLGIIEINNEVTKKYICKNVVYINFVLFTKYEKLLLETKVTGYLTNKFLEIFHLENMAENIYK